MKVNKTKTQNIIVAVTGGIACYKSCELVRLLIQVGHSVKVIMTENAKQFVHPNTFSALSQHIVYDDLFMNENKEMAHITLAKWADTIVIAPATATTIAKLAIGLADNLLTSVCLASEAKCFVAAAMNKVMWEKKITQSNIATLKSQDYSIIMPAAGEQACGDVGVGRMQEPSNIMAQIFQQSNLLAGLHILITAGPTQEKIDPVRYISNFSSGKMGYALAHACQQLGAEVHLISGPTDLISPSVSQLTSVKTAKEMLNAVLSCIDSADIFISAAAVADYVPSQFLDDKIKKIDEKLTIQLNKTQDILKIIGDKYPEKFTIGFCAETKDLINSAKQKLINKNLNAIIANKISEKGYPFSDDTNELIYINDKDIIDFPKDTKSNLAYKLMDYIYQDFKLDIEKMQGISA